jgi:hypothetical protein
MGGWDLEPEEWQRTGTTLYICAQVEVCLSKEGLEAPVVYI